MSDDDDFGSGGEEDGDGGTLTTNPLADADDDDTAAVVGLGAGAAGSQVAAGPEDEMPPERPDVPPPSWFETGLWTKLDSPAVVWLLRAVFLTSGNVGFGGATSIAGLPLHWLIVCICGLICTEAFAFAFEELRSLVRAGSGGLAQLSRAVDRDGDEATPTTIAADAFDSLVRWRKGTRCAATVWFVLLAMLSFLVVLLVMVVDEVPTSPVRDARAS